MCISDRLASKCPRGHPIRVAHAYITARSSHQKCHFGCSSRAKLKTQCLVPVWRGAKLGANLCGKCHTRLISELNDKDTPMPRYWPKNISVRFIGCAKRSSVNSLEL